MGGGSKTDASMLASSASKTRKIVVASIVSFRLSDLSDWATHRLVGHVQKPQANFFDRKKLTTRVFQILVDGLCELLECYSRGLEIQWLILMWAKDLWEVLGRQAAKY